MPTVPFRLNSRATTGSVLRGCVFGALLGGLAGCAASLPKLTPPVPAQWQHAVASDPAKSTDLHGWWHAFADPQLDALVDRALNNNLDVAQAVERLRAVRVLHDRSQARYLPSLTASTNDVIDPDANASYFLVGFDASWEFGLFGRSEGTRREAKGALDASIADLRSAQVSLVAEVVREWIELRTAQQQEQLLSQINQARQQEWQSLQVRQRLQLAAPGAVDQAQAAFAQSAAALAAPRQAIGASVQRLAVLLGQNHPDPAWLKPGAPPELGAWQLDSAPADLLRTRPEIARAEADVLQAAGAQALAHADLFPSIGIGGSIDWSTDINNNKKHPTTPNAIDSIGPVINIPLFDWGIRLAAKQAKDHELKASVLAYRQAVLQGVAEVETALGSVQQQQQREQQSLLAWQALQRVDQTVQTRVGLRLGSPLDLAESRVAAAQAAIELADARAGHNLAYVALFKALGGAPLPSADQMDASSPEASSGTSSGGGQH
ncbi:RND transporter [Rhodanobacter sp. B04]|uniref:efflux transporter outer membrane subunit n=1 Tax=Rhodanobacter sp. B04 TaxID=1945860 RepID=UPI000984D339|nr:efflux transporter outer membrane subunit [Rhodanobacter sp. B04]OOG65015.1 RND transporter [Rhodanobacter sp. B04]